VVNPANHHLYYLLDAASWTRSEAESLSMGGHLVTINDEAENNWVTDTFALDRNLWIGFVRNRSRRSIFDNRSSLGWLSEVLGPVTDALTARDVDPGQRFDEVRHHSGTDVSRRPVVEGSDSTRPEA
jgi:hypothetical protein